MLLEERLLKRLREEKDRVKELILDPYQAEQFSDYRYLLGLFNGTDRAITMCRETFGKEGESDDDEHCIYR